MRVKFCRESRDALIKIGNSRDVWIEGNIIKLLDDCDGEFSDYISTASEKDTEKRKKRLDITRQVQDQNKELQAKAQENDDLMTEIKDALKVAEDAKEVPVSTYWIYCVICSLGYRWNRNYNHWSLCSRNVERFNGDHAYWKHMVKFIWHSFDKLVLYHWHNYGRKICE